MTKAANSLFLLCCSKCGSADILTRWHIGGRCGNGGCGYFAKLVEQGEHLHRTCQTCLHEWADLPNDENGEEA